VDRRFLEFWGNLLINASKGQKQIEDLTQWINQGLKGSEDLNAMFQRFYMRNGPAEESPDYLRAWQNAARDFQETFKDYLNLMGVVPMGEHLKLVKKYEDLKKRAADQDETIAHLRMLLDAKGIDHGEALMGFQDLIKKQTDQFQDLVKGFGQFPGKDPSNDGGDNDNS
jgi:phage tail tape-measure protein